MTNRQVNDPATLTPSLVVRLRAGDSEAGGLLDAIYRKSLVRFCWGYLGGLDEAEDAVQEIFCKVLKSATIPDDFRAWVYRAARNHCLNVLRSRRRKRDDRAFPTESKIQARLTGNLTRMVRREQRSHLLRLLRALPMEQREVIRLRYTEGLPRSEIARVLEIPESVVKSRLFEGMKKLRSHTSLLDGQ